ncbi:HNH endonuclease signature motif containing protein [Corynebacterium pacaense]|uniref:HNH endonuclease signature motif containing protein n=1 Tax=Corynebacterium pacaense TaxID=1816684 RepID=UPI0009BABD6B|nr:HNH endonuclease signature motif containing protein [Corynebacterium pacaense]
MQVHSTVYYSHQDPANPESATNYELTRHQHQRWALLLCNRDDLDADSLLLELKRITGESRHTIKLAITAMEAMDNLPNLRIVQENHFFLSLAFLARIMEAVAQAEPSHWATLDVRIVERLTPRNPGEILPEAASIARQITMWIKELDSAFSGNTGKSSCTPHRDGEFLELRHRDGMTTFRGAISAIDGTRLHKALKSLSPTNLIDGLKKLLDAKAPVRITQYLYTPLVGGVSWIPQVGYLSQADSRRMCGLAEKVTEIDEVATRVESGYTPSALLRAYVVARDGTCRHPGCTISADLCDLDHVIAFDEGGPTTAWNLQCLCRHHHNMKTDGRLSADMTSVGDMRWIGPCNTAMYSTPQGPLAQEMPTGRWGQKMRARMDQRFAGIRARGLRI